MPSNARMTIRFEPPANPKRKPLETPAARPADPIEIFPFAKEEIPSDPVVFESWDSPYQDDIRALEEMIRKSDFEKPVIETEAGKASVSKNKKARSDLQDIAVLEWLGDKSEDATPVRAENVDGKRNGNDNGWYDSIATTEIVRERGPSWGRVILSVAGAIATGVLFGYMVLGLFTGEPLFPNQPEAGNPPSAQAVAGNGGAESPGTAEAAKSRKAVGTGQAGDTNDTEKSNVKAGVSPAGEISADRYYMLQFGLFKSEDSMEIAAGQLQDKGYSWGTDASDGYRVYAAAAMTKEEAELLAAQMKGLEVYIKPMSGSSVRSDSDQLTKEGAGFVEAGAAMVRELVRISAAGLQDRQPQALSAERAAVWEETLLRWQSNSSYTKVFGAEASKEAAQIAQSLNAGESAMEEFLREPSRKSLWAVQTAAMGALLAERRLRDLLQPAG